MWRYFCNPSSATSKVESCFVQCDWNNAASSLLSGLVLSSKKCKIGPMVLFELRTNPERRLAAALKKYVTISKNAMKLAYVRQTSDAHITPYTLQHPTAGSFNTYARRNYENVEIKKFVSDSYWLSPISHQQWKQPRSFWCDIGESQYESETNIFISTFS